MARQTDAHKAVEECSSEDRGIVKCCGSGSVDHAATFFSFASTSSPFLNSAPALTNATR